MVAFYLVAGALAGMLVVFSLHEQSIWIRLAAGAVPLSMSALWIKVFVHGRPPAYQSDVIERYLRGSDFRLVPSRWRGHRHPRALLLNRVAEQEARHG